MRPVHVAFVGLAAFAAGAALVRLATPPRHAASADEASGAARTAAGEREVLYWYDPMVPQHRFDAPGKSPFMDMQLVPRYADESEAAGEVSIDPALGQSLGVRTAPVRRGTLERSVHANGTVAFDERAASIVAAPVAAIVERLHVRATFDRVAAGDPIATLLAPEWSTALAEYAALLRARSAGLAALRDAARQRLVLLGVPEARIRAVERGHAPGARLTIAAPRAGVVRELGVREGASVAAGALLARIDGLDPVWIEAAVPERDAALVRRGTPVRATVRAHPGEYFAGEVESLLPAVDAATRTLTARIVLPNPGARLVPGMYAALELGPGPGAETALRVPTEAVIATGRRNVVIVATGAGRYRAQEVRIGREAGGESEVLEGLAEGDEVVLSGQFLIDSEASLRGALGRLGTGGQGEKSAPATTPEPHRHAAPGSAEGERPADSDAEHAP
jgi:Cu(I)/Ag(I) efflux system membrane fusion protein